MSQLHYKTFHWLQDIGINRLHFKSTDSLPLLLKKTDALVQAYVMARKTRSDILTSAQYKSAVIFQAFAHSGMIGLGGWLLSWATPRSDNVAAEVIVGTLLLNLDTVARGMMPPSMSPRHSTNCRNSSRSRKRMSPVLSPRPFPTPRCMACVSPAKMSGMTRRTEHGSSTTSIWESCRAKKSVSFRKPA